MTFNSFETSPDSGEPVELYEIRIGSETPYRYTSSEDTQTVGGNVYTKESIKRSKTQDGLKQRAGEFSVDLPSSNPFVLRYAGTVPGARVTMIVSRFHRGDTPTPEVQQIFDGLVESVKLTDGGHLATVTSRAAIAASSQTIPQDGYQTQCNNSLYGPRCLVDRTNPLFRSLDATVDAIDGRLLTVSAASIFADGWFRGGRATINGDSDHRMIRSHVGDQVELLTPFTEAPTIVTLYAGCKHSVSACKEKFDNVTRFRGFAYVPNRNPFIDGVL